MARKTLSQLQINTNSKFWWIGTLIAINVIFNRETREDGGMPPYERAYLNDTFMHTGLGIGIIGLTARTMFQSGFMYRMMATNPWVVMIGGLGLSIGTMMATRATSPEKYDFPPFINNLC
jgi:hypothetical protein